MRASALAFQTLWALAPCGLLFLAALGWIVPDPSQMSREVSRYAARAFPGHDVAPLLRELMNAADLAGAARRLHEARVSASLAGVAMQLWTGAGLMAALTAQLDIVMGVAHGRSAPVRRAVGLFFFLLFGAIVMGAFVFVLGPRLALWFSFPVRNLPTPWDTLAAEAVTALTAVVLFTLAYRVLPAASVSLRSALRAGVVAAGFWTLARIGFTFGLTLMADMANAYGVVSSVLVLLAWIWATWLILLSGALLCRVDPAPTPSTN